MQGLNVPQTCDVHTGEGEVHSTAGHTNLALQGSAAPTEVCHDNCTTVVALKGSVLCSSLLQLLLLLMPQLPRTLYLHRTLAAAVFCNPACCAWHSCLLLCSLSLSDEKVELGRAENPSQAHAIGIAFGLCEKSCHRLSCLGRATQ